MFPGKPTRHRNWDYARPGWYLVTMVVQGRRRMLGHLLNGVLVPGPIGRTVMAAWDETLAFRPWVSCLAAAFMPDHVHVLVGWNVTPPDRDGRLGRLVQHFKGASAADLHFRRQIPIWDRFWQPGFHDRIIRGPRHLERARRYVEANPRREWERQGKGR